MQVETIFPENCSYIINYIVEYNYALLKGYVLFHQLPRMLQFL
jgi:hypothetical protein